MMTIGFVFSGQGSQFNGMGQDLYEYSDVFKETINEASRILNLDMLELLFTQNDRLHQTKYTQPAILTMSIGISRMMREELNLTPSIVAGLSLGEISALVESNMLTFSDALVLVKKRGELMETAVEDGVGAMSAILGLDRQLIDNICQEISQPNCLVEAVNYNMPAQTVIAGHTKAVEKAEQYLSKNGAKRVIRLNVSGPFHTSLMSQAANDFEKEVRKKEIKNMSIPLITNINGKILDQHIDLAEHLNMQMQSPVYFEECINEMKRQGVDILIEVGAGKSLCQFIKKIDASIHVQHVDSVKSFEQLKKKLEKWVS